MYVGPIPFKVEPIFALPFAASEAASNKRCVGKIKCAFLESNNFDFPKTLPVLNAIPSIISEEESHHIDVVDISDIIASVIYTKARMGSLRGFFRERE